MKNTEKVILILVTKDLEPEFRDHIADKGVFRKELGSDIHVLLSHIFDLIVHRRETVNHFLINSLLPCCTCLSFS